MNKKEVISNVSLFFLSLGTLITLVNIIYILITDDFVSFIGSIDFILTPYNRFYQMGELIDIIAFILMLYISIFLLAMSYKEALNKNNNRGPMFSFSLTWWYFCGTFSYVMSGIPNDTLEENTLINLCILSFYHIVSTVLFVNLAIAYKNGINSKHQEITNQKLEKNFLSTFCCLGIISSFNIVFLYFNSPLSKPKYLYNMSKNLCNLLINITYIFAILLFASLYMGNLQAYNKYYKKQNAESNNNSTLTKINIQQFCLLGIFIISYFALKLVFAI